MPKLSILIPHKHEPENDKALSIALSCIAANTQNDYELILDTTTPGDPYVLLNDMAQRASGEWLFFGNSDLFPAPGWDEPLLAAAERGLIVNATLVECGAIGVHIQNIHRSFGMTPDTFDRVGFEAWAVTNPELPAGDGFVFYALIARADFLDAGGFDTASGSFPDPLDRLFWDRWIADGKLIVRAASLLYHLQNYSNALEQEKGVRHG